MPAIAAECIASHFASRQWVLNSGAARPFIHLLCVTAGTAAAHRDDDEIMTWSGPTLAWLPAGRVAHLDISAGTVASLLRLRADSWHRYLPPSAETAYLDLADISGVLACSVEPELARQIAQSIAAIRSEIATPARGAAASIMSSELTLCALRFWRLFADQSEAETPGNGTEILSRFRRLVEERYHQQLRVADYARLLGVTPDRLHALCSRALKRSPRALIQQRILQEAATRLETSGAAVKQIAFALGFKDTAYFSRFFTKHVGEAPVLWRRSMAARARNGRLKPSLDFADWP